MPLTHFFNKRDQALPSLCLVYQLQQSFIALDSYGLYDFYFYSFYAQYTVTFKLGPLERRAWFYLIENKSVLPILTVKNKLQLTLHIEFEMNLGLY